MAAYIGRIPVPEIPVAGTFPLRTDFAHGRQQGRTFVAHQFADGTEQRFYVGDPAPRYTFVRRTLTPANRALLAAFWQSMEGCVGAFTYNVPQEDGSFVPTTVCFENQPLAFEDLVAAITSVGLTFVAIPDPATAPSYNINATVTRFPDATLGAALLAEVQEIIPLIRIRVAEAAVPDIFLSDRLVTVGGLVYLPRLLRVGEPGGDVLIQQSIDGSSDDVQFTFGNADRVMIRLANDTDLVNARIELSLFHVGAGYKLDLWAGLVTQWASDTGPEFTVHASDVLSALTTSSPVGTCSRSCWRRYSQDGCPATPGSQALDLVHFPSADARWCDQGYNTDNGCLAHSGGANPTKYFFGAVWVENQTVKVRDNSTGHWGLGRQNITPTSQIDDSLWGQSIPEIWHDDDGVPQRGLQVACRIVAGRDESDFYIALGVVGRGPLGAYTAAQMIDRDSDGVKETLVASTLDGQAHHGFKTDDNGDPEEDSSNLGLRQVLGSDPAGLNDFFSLGRVGNAPGSWREVVGGASVYEDTYAADLAFIEIRRTDESGMQLSTPGSHAMVAVISKGLTGKVWAAPGARADQPGCTNPFWVAINTFLRAIALAGADSATQEPVFDVSAAIAAAAQADTLVPSVFASTLVPNPAPDPTTETWMLGGTGAQSVFVIGSPALSLPTVVFGNGGSGTALDPSEYTWDGKQTITLNTPVDNVQVSITFTYCDGTYTAVPGMEKQFRFKGTVDATKPTRDWLRDILNNGLGHFTWSFGKLRVGCRNSAAPVTWFQPGNILFNSLHLEPIRPGFEKLTVSFGDEDYLFAKNTVSYTDQDYAAKHNRVANPREAQLGLVGSSTKSQSMRIAVARTREELGGVGQAEQTAARAASWRSTIMALDVEAGDVVGLLDPEVSGGAFRLRSFRLNRDWSVDLAGSTVTPSMYEIGAGLTKPGYSELLTAGANNEIVFVGTDVIRVIFA